MKRSSPDSDINKNIKHVTSDDDTKPSVATADDPPNKKAKHRTEESSGVPILARAEGSVSATEEPSEKSTGDSSALQTSTDDVARGSTSGDSREMTPEGEEVVAVIATRQEVNKPPPKIERKGGGRVRLPEKLLYYLNEDPIPDVIWWMQDGNGFAMNVDRSAELLESSFRCTKLASFVRSLNRWGFRRVFYHALPANVIAFYHPLFKRDALHRVKEIKMISHSSQYEQVEQKEEQEPAPQTVGQQDQSASGNEGKQQQGQEQQASATVTLPQQQQVFLDPQSQQMLLNPFILLQQIQQFQQAQQTQAQQQQQQTQPFQQQISQQQPFNQILQGVPQIQPQQEVQQQQEEVQQEVQQQQQQQQQPQQFSGQYQMPPQFQQPQNISQQQFQPLLPVTQQQGGTQQEAQQPQAQQNIPPQFLQQQILNQLSQQGFVNLFAPPGQPQSDDANHSQNSGRGDEDTNPSSKPEE